MQEASQIQPGDRVLLGQKLITISDDFAQSLEPGDAVVGIEQTGQVRRIPRSVNEMVATGVGRAQQAFRELAHCSDAQIHLFFDKAASLLADDGVFGLIKEVNDSDVRDAHLRGRSTTRLMLSDKMRADMINAFRLWRDLAIGAFTLEDVVVHEGWEVEQWKSPLGVVGFVFEGRPNVFADATGVLRTGNAVVFRIGSVALNTASAIMKLVIAPALNAAGLPQDAIVLLDSKEHSAGWSLFSDSRLALAVARGSGEAVSELGSIARQAGIPVSLHGTGGAWMLVGKQANLERLHQSVLFSLDRKVCNTLNVVTVLRENAEVHVPIVLRAAHEAAQQRGALPRIHCVDDALSYCPEPTDIDVVRADGVKQEKQFTASSISDLSHEFEWEETPEFFLVLVDTLEDSVGLFNTYSPQFVASIISDSDEERDLVWRRCNAPFVGDGFTRWVDGQFALDRPELGLSNWQMGRLFGRGGIMSGDSVYTVRLRVKQSNPSLHR